MEKKAYTGGGGEILCLSSPQGGENLYIRRNDGIG